MPKLNTTTDSSYHDSDWDSVIFCPFCKSKYVSIGDVKGEKDSKPLREFTCENCEAVWLAPSVPGSFFSEDPNEPKWLTVSFCPYCKSQDIFTGKKKKGKYPKPLHEFTCRSCGNFWWVHKDQFKDEYIKEKEEERKRIIELNKTGSIDPFSAKTDDIPF